MINYETILSNYDDRLTLMQWLKKVELALMAAALASVTITQPTDDTAVFNFQFADGTSLSSPSLNLPRGPQGVQGAQGEQGAQGVGVSNVTINSNSHLIVTLTNGVEIDAGYIETGSGIVVDTELSATSTNPVENRVIYNVVTTAQNTITALGTRVTDAETDIETLDESVTNLQTDLTALGGRVTTEEGNLLALSQRVTTAEGAIADLENEKLEEVTAADVNSGNATNGQVLTADGNGGAAWTTPQSGGGGTQLYKHTIGSYAVIISNDNTPFDGFNDASALNSVAASFDIISSKKIFYAYEVTGSPIFMYEGMVSVLRANTDPDASYPVQIIDIDENDFATDVVTAL